MLAAHAEGRTFKLHATRPDASHNRRLTRADLPSGAAHVITPVEPETGKLIEVRISGPIEQYAGYYDPCGGWTDGNDAIAERMCAAFEEGDVQLRVESPGGAFAGSFQAIERVLAAKAKYGRRCTGFVDEQACSLGFLWMACVCDEIFTPAYGQAGSIGARSAHASIAGALAREGVDVNFFCWPNEGKVALAPERPLSEMGRERGNRDVSIAGEAFCKAVCESPIGMRRGLDWNAIVAMSADVYTGQAAVDAGLADGVASLEEVTAYALRMAEGGDGGDMPGLGRGEEPEKDKPEENRGEDDKKPEERAGDDPMKCGRCGEESPEDARFCAKCGMKMADDDKPEGDDDEHDKPPPSSKKPEAIRSVASRVAPTVAASAGLAEIIGADPRSSLPAQKAHALDVRAVLDKCARMTGQSSPAAILGALDAVERDASNAPRYKRERDAERAKATTTQRRDLAMRLIACNVEGWERGNVFADVKGEKFTDRINDMKVETLRGMVEGFEKAKATRTDRDPFQPARDKAEAAEAQNRPAAALLSGEPTDAQITAAMALPAVKQIAAQTGRDLKAVAVTYIKTAAANAAQNGAMAR
jgi:ClpP class serine protease